jgi:hypothetical protein
MEVIPHRIFVTEIGQHALGFVPRESCPAKRMENGLEKPEMRKTAI